jgi:DNA invertase Pin-like site-specific DNA recombinase
VKGKCAILLVRVSTEIQNYEPQLHDLEQYAKKKGYSKLKRIETKESGLADSSNKVGLHSLYKFITENPEYNTVFATELSRLARRQSILHEIKEWLIKNNVQLYLKDTGYSLFDESGKVSAAGEVMFTLYGYFAESEIKQKKERFIRSKRLLMEMGLSISGKTLFGYERISTPDKKTTLRPHPENAAIVKSIFRWYVYGIENMSKHPSIKSIALECIKRNYPSYTHSKRNVNKLLKEEGYTGQKITNNKRKNPNYQDENRDEKYIITQNKIKYPPIIDTALFDKAQVKLRENNSKADKSSKNTTILSGLIICPMCGNHLNGDYRKKEGLISHSYRCSGRAKAKPCDFKQTIGMAMMDSVVWSFIKTDLKALSEGINENSPDADLAGIRNQKKHINGRIKEISKEVDELKAGLKNSITSRNFDLSDIVATFQSRIVKLDNEKGRLENELGKLEMKEEIKSSKLKNVEDVVMSNLPTIELSKELLKFYVNYFIDHILILFHDKNFTIIGLRFKSPVTEQFIYNPNNSHKTSDELTHLIIDKRTTLNIKAFVSYYGCKHVKEDVFVINSKKISIKDLYSEMDKPLKLRNPDFRLVRRFSFQKLRVY